MPSLTSLRAKTATLPVDIFDDGETIITVTYRKLAYTAELEDRTTAAQNSNHPAQAIQEVFVELIEAWDLKASDDDDTIIPITMDALTVVPSEALGKVLAAVAEHKNREESPNPKTSKPSRSR